ncbi:hypothetical protein [Streptomyces sp. NPDC057280]|uniref:hypothetical protein n=1 Tax=Streptomyces sp. NPDC057280 TaxID=3346081 RepID=UPI003643C1EF
MVTTVTGRASTGGAQLVCAGDEWDVIMVARFLALRALENLTQPGAVVVDPHPSRPALYFLVPSGSTACWRLPQRVAFGDLDWTLPPEGKATPPGPYWLIQLGHGLTRVCELRRALATAVGRPGGLAGGR